MDTRQFPRLAEHTGPLAKRFMRDNLPSGETGPPRVYVATDVPQPPSAPAEVGHRSCSACLVAHAAMKLGRKLRWDPATETFPGDDEANQLLSRPQRAPWGSDAVLKAAAG